MKLQVPSRQRGGAAGVEAPALQTLPSSEESERAVLASVLLSPRILPTITGRINDEDFFLDKHQLIFKAMLDLQEKESEIDLRTLQAHMQLKGTFEQVGGMVFLAGLDLDLPDIGRVDTYVEIVKERSVRRRLVLKCQELVFGCLEGGLDAQEALAEAEKSIFGLGEEAVQKGFTPLQEVYEATIASLEKRAAGGQVGIPSGFYDWDRMTQGLAPGALIIIAGRPGMGKTSFAVNVAQNVSIREESSVAIFSLEMGEQELVQRVLASEADVPFSNLRSGKMSENQWGRVYETTRRTQTSRLFIDDSPNPTLLEIASKTRRLKAEKGLDLLMVDYLQLMQAGGKYESRQLEIAAISRGLKQLAKELEIPVIALSQLSRQTERRANDHRPQLSDLRESGAIEQDADMVCFIYRDEIYNKDDPDNKGLAELIIAKHRAGETGTVDLVFMGETTTFRNMEKVHTGEQGF